MNMDCYELYAMNAHAMKSYCYEICTFPFINHNFLNFLLNILLLYYSGLNSFEKMTKCLASQIVKFCQFFVLTNDRLLQMNSKRCKSSLDFDYCFRSFPISFS